MADRDDKPPWYPKWREALDQVIATGIARDRIKRGTPEREAAEHQHEDALTHFRAAAQRIAAR